MSARRGLIECFPPPHRRQRNKPDASAAAAAAQDMNRSFRLRSRHRPLMKEPPMLAVRPHLNRYAFALGLVVATGLAYWTCAAEDTVERDVIYVPTPEPVVDKMLELAKPKKGEILYDL